MGRSRIALALVLAFALPIGTWSAPAASQAEWPSKPIVFVVPFPAGGGTDAFARPLATQLGNQLGKSIVIANHGGAGGNVGAVVASRAAADGYTFFVGAVHHAIAPSVYAKLDYDLERDFSPVTSIAHMPQVVVVNPARIRATSLRALIGAVQSQPGKYTFGSGGNGTSHHVSGELFKMVTHSDLLHVPFKGNGPAMTALMGGEIDMMIDALGSAAGAIRGGKVKALAVAAARRAPGFPDVPTTDEAGLPQFVIGTWYGVWARKGTPQAIVDRLQAESTRALDTAALRDVWFSQGAAAGGEPPLQFAAFVRKEVERWGRIAKESGARAD